ncbi:ABC transporter permease [Rubellimicrobium arenae]|uniref:ABC transporter permease n=1 Tax=Rubellimicrobium arenae TaxID=2817372 RepID=UPI001B3115C0|nr:ABC transporter permease subunit [Rubellimicrobium arenae]
MKGREATTPGWLGILPGTALVVLFLIPFGIMLAVSVAQRETGGFYQWGFDLSGYQRFLSAFFGGVLLTSVGIAAGTAAIAVALALPFTVILAGLSRRTQTAILVVLLSVLSLSEVIVGFSVSTLLSQTAGVGNILAWLGLTAEARAYTPSLFALMTGLTYLSFPYAVLVLYPPVARLDPELAQAARTMGASPLRTFFSVTMPLLRAPLLGALILVFVFALGSYLLPQVLGRPEHWTLSVHITDQAIYQSNLPFAAAMAAFLLLVALAMVGVALLLAREKGDRA